MKPVPITKEQRMHHVAGDSSGPMTQESSASASERPATVAQKAEYVKKEVGNAEGHHCHWPGCNKAVPPAMWGCKTHWFKLPALLRARIWRAYKPGQEISKTPSAEYIAVAQDVQKWIEAHA